MERRGQLAGGGFLFKLKRLNKPAAPYVILIAGLTVVTLLTALSGLWHYQYELAHQSSAAPVLAARIKPGFKHAVAGDQTVAPALPGAGATVGPGVSNAAPRSSGQPASLGNAVPAGSSAGSGLSAPPATIAVNLSVNGEDQHSQGVVQLTSGSNQCSVLTQALTSGVISELDMEYSSQYGTQAVYKIDGVGEAGVIRWTYTVNGKSPQKGCSLIAVHNGDSVSWQY